MLRLSSRSLLRNRIAVINRSAEKVAVYPVDITLHIPELNITLPAVIDYARYVEMRYSEAAKKCSETDRPRRCGRYVDKYFKRFLNVRAFNFGEIKPGKKKVGYFAFNLPDPFNTSREARDAGKVLQKTERLHKGKIIVTVSSVALESSQTELVFPVKIIASSDKSSQLLTILHFF
jgi:hypothetical protein